MAMTPPMFEVGAGNSNGLEYDTKAAANFYDILAHNADAIGMYEDAERLRAMAEIDRAGIEESAKYGLAPIFLHPSVYPIEGESSELIYTVSVVRGLIINPDRVSRVTADVCFEVDTEDDKVVQERLKELRNLLVPVEQHDVQRIGYVDNNDTCLGEDDPYAFRETFTYSTVLDGIAMRIQETRFNANWGRRTRQPNGEFEPSPPLAMRRLEVVVFRTQ